MQFIFKCLHIRLKRARETLIQTDVTPDEIRASHHQNTNLEQYSYISLLGASFLSTVNPASELIGICCSYLRSIWTYTLQRVVIFVTFILPASPKSFTCS
jgi:hypothetical protein